MFNQMRNKIVELETQTQNATKLEDLLINSVTGGSPYIATFFWATSIFIFIASASKLWLYGAVFKNFALKIWHIIYLVFENGNMSSINSNCLKMYSYPMLRISKQRDVHSLMSNLRIYVQQ